MIPADSFATYSQYNEDVIIAALLSEQKKGFYIDVGANHEEYHSVTKYFYKRGWRGINIEPIPRLIKEFKVTRKRDINLGIAVSTKKGELLFREYPDHDGLSTLSRASKDEIDKAQLPYKDYKIKVDTLANVISTYAKDTPIDFLKIDVEGFEGEVLKGNNWNLNRPRVICIEANHRNEDWSEFLIDKKYTRVIFDGLNEYYLANEERGLFVKYAERAALLKHNAIQNHYLKLWQGDLNHTDELRQMTERQDALIKSLQNEQIILKQHMRSPRFLVKKLVKIIANKASGKQP